MHILRSTIASPTPTPSLPPLASSPASSSRRDPPGNRQNLAIFRVSGSGVVTSSESRRRSHVPPISRTTCPCSTLDSPAAPTWQRSLAEPPDHEPGPSPLRGNPFLRHSVPPKKWQSSTVCPPRPPPRPPTPDPSYGTPSPLHQHHPPQRRALAPLAPEQHSRESATTRLP